LAPRRLESLAVFQSLCGISKKFVTTNRRWWNPPSTTLVIGVKEERIERDPKAHVAYLDNMDVGQPLWRAEPRDKSSVSCAFTSYLFLDLPCVISSIFFVLPL
jgi:hypothetical protein